MQDANDFLAECRALHQILASLTEAELAIETKFKRWTISDIVRHLMVWDVAARLTLQDANAFQRFLAPVTALLKTNNLRVFEREMVAYEGYRLVAEWWESCQKTAQLYAAADAKKLLNWAGPDLNARTCINSRLMETWSHSQAIYDELGIERCDTDLIKNIVHIGVRTFSWTFQNRGLAPPGPIPGVTLTAPSGTSWCWANGHSAETIVGKATEFCQVVTQTRNIADTQLKCDGPVGRCWMAVAQCFAGPPSDPPEVGQRYRNQRRS